MKNPFTQVSIPAYSQGEELFNTVSHAFGAALGVIVLAACVTTGAVQKDAYGMICGAVFGICMILLYAVSSIYHGLGARTAAKRVFRVLDHCAIYLLIAGTYTPFCLCAIREVSAPLGWAYFALIWGFTILGTTLCVLNMHRFRAVSMILYLSMGWCVVLSFDVLRRALATQGLVLLLLGGVAYTLGVVLFGLGHFWPYAHSVFHLLVLAGSILHAACVLLYVL